MNVVELSTLNIVLLTISGGFLLWFVWEKSHRKTRLMPGGLHPDLNLPFDKEFELYHNDLSLCSKKARVCLSELGIKYKAHHIDLIETGSYENISRRYLQINPSGILPAMVHNGHPIYESHDIISYAANHAAENISGAIRLIPDCEDKKMLMQQWVDRASMNDNPLEGFEQSAAHAVAGLTLPLFFAGMRAIPVSKVFEGLLFHRIRFRAFAFLMFKLLGLKRMPIAKPIVPILKGARQNMGVHLDSLEQHLATTGDWIVGEQFTLADVSWMVIFERLREANWESYFLEEQQRPHTLAYWQRLKQRRSYGQAIESFSHPSVAVATEMIVKQKQTDTVFLEFLEAAS